MPWTRIDHDDRGPEFVYYDEFGHEQMKAFFGGSSLPIIQLGETVDPARELCVNVLLDPEDHRYAHFCNLEEHIEQMQELAKTLREWDQEAYLRRLASED